MKNSEIAARLRELGDLYELDGAVSYRVLAYKQAAKAILDSPVSVTQMAEQGRLEELPGVGKTIAEKVSALLAEGEIPAARKLKERIPATLVDMLRIPGLGAKTVRAIHDQLGIEDLAQLQAAAEQQEIRGLKGLGAKAEENILKGLAGLEARGADEERILLSHVLPLAERLAADIGAHPACDRLEIAGSARRMVETCKDIDLIASSDQPADLVTAFVGHELVDEARSKGEAGASVLTHHGTKVDLRVVAPDQFGNLLQHFTGSQAHNVQLREAAVKQGLSVSEYGVAETESGESLRCRTEAEVYERLGYRYIEPELREGRGELEAARTDALPELIVDKDIRGDLHCHTTLSDGRSTLREMASAAKRMGYGYLAVTDHSASHGFGDHVTADQLRKRIDEVRNLNDELKRFTLLVGSEVNIGTDGSLDYPDELLAELDWVVASLHTSFRMGDAKLTARMIMAAEHPYVDCLGHPTGRLIGRREPYGIDIERVCAAAAETGTMIEINANPNRRDLSEHHARLANEAGVRIVINTDAHGVDTLAENMRYGIATARRAWLTKADVANTLPWSRFAKLRKRAG